MGIERGGTWDPSPEYVAYIEKECGKLPENESIYSYYYSRYNSYVDKGTT